jgi:soluble lytic murein transglycosylase
MLGRYRESVRVWIDPVGLMLYRRFRLRPNHLTIIGLGVSLLAATAFCAGRTRSAGALLILAGLCDFFDGSLARVSGQVSAFGAFLDSVIDRYSDLVVLLGIVVLFAQMPHARGAIVAMAGLIGSMMVSYTRARAESIGVRCTVGMMERPERMICLIAGALLDLLEPALWVLAILANLTAIQRIAFTWRATRDATLLRTLLFAAVLLVPVAVAGSETVPVAAERDQAWAAAVEAYQGGDVELLVREFGTDAARDSPIGDHVRYLLADALARVDDLDGARTAALSVVEKYPTSRLAPRALLLAATLNLRAGDDAAAQTVLVRLVDSYPDASELPTALYLLGLSAETRGQLDSAAQIYREIRILAPASGYADGAEDRLAALQTMGVRPQPLTPAQRADRAERLLRAGVPDTAMSEAERLLDEVKTGPIAVRALRVIADGARRLGRHEQAARTLDLLVDRSPAERRPALRLEQARLFERAGERARALAALDAVVSTGAEANTAEALYLKGRALEAQAREAEQARIAAEARARDAEMPARRREFELKAARLGAEAKAREAEATAVYRQVAANHPTREAAAASLWQLGWLGYLKRDAQGAQQSWTRLAALGSVGAYRYPALYWAGRARELAGGDAAELYGQILADAPRSYYGLLASARIGRANEGGATVPISLPTEPREAIANDPGFARVELLRRINLGEDAAQELEDVVQDAAGDPIRLYGLAGAYVEVERYHMALRIMRRHFQAQATTGDPSLPRAFWEMFYPWGWRDDVLAAAQDVKLDPYLVAAVVREESSYYPRAVSRTGARGLMQLMPTTARLLAPAGDLDDPVFNIQLGTRFLAGLLREFTDPRLALAAYNAGPNRVRQWWAARRSDDIEVFVEQIPFDETRLYVKKVVLSWDEYRRIYAGP